MNLWALNEEMGYDSRIKEKIDVEKARKSIHNPEKLKNFIEHLDQDHDVIVEKEVFDLIKNESPRKECNIVIIDDENKPERGYDGRLRVKVDVSSVAETDVDDYEAESEEDEVILTGDRESRHEEICYRIMHPSF
jgi:hypothetical protein